MLLKSLTSYCNSFTAAFFHSLMDSSNVVFWWGWWWVQLPVMWVQTEKVTHDSYHSHTHRIRKFSESSHKEQSSIVMLLKLKLSFNYPFVFVNSEINCSHLDFKVTLKLSSPLHCQQRLNLKTWCLLSRCSVPEHFKCLQRIPGCILWLTAHSQQSNKVWISSYLLATNLTCNCKGGFQSCPTTHPHTNTNTHTDISLSLVCVWATGCHSRDQTHSMCHLISINQLRWKIIPTFQGCPHHGNHRSGENPWIPLCSLNGFKWQCCSWAFW